jgi:hypothetical protein
MKPAFLAVAVSLAASSVFAAPEPNEVEALARALGMELPAFPQGRELEALVEAAKPFPLGGPDNPVRAPSIRASYEYLARLRCPGGDRPGVQRLGTAPKSPFGRIVDVYEVRCPQTTREVHIDAYHPGHKEKRAPEGFRLR